MYVILFPGRIKLDLNPQDYMEMYSYGVYLIDILQVKFISNQCLMLRV